ncbi:MAG TPA: zinc ribbon domain-containing protein [Solirubrobacteraceae bacterium]|jgi:putative FmdB family regulatory protein
MPLYDFRCRACGERFEALAAPSEAPACTACGAQDVERLFTPFAGPFTVGLRGAAARRSNAVRGERERQREERRAARRAKPEGG